MTYGQFYIFDNAYSVQSSNSNHAVIKDVILSRLYPVLRQEFGTPDAAERCFAQLPDLQKQNLIEIENAAIVTWPAGKKKPKTRQLVPLTSLGALDGAFWGMLFGFLFFVPLFGVAMGALTGAISGHFQDYGIDDDFIKEVQGKVTEGTSALFLLTGKVTLDKVEEAIKEDAPELIQSNLSYEQEAALKERFQAE